MYRHGEDPVRVSRVGRSRLEMVLHFPSYLTHTLFLILDLSKRLKTKSLKPIQMSAVASELFHDAALTSTFAVKSPWPAVVAAAHALEGRAGRQKSFEVARRDLFLIAGF